MEERDPEKYEYYCKVLAQDLAERIFKRFALRAEQAQRQSTITMLGFSLNRRHYNGFWYTHKVSTSYYIKGLISVRSAADLTHHTSVTAIAIRPFWNRNLGTEVDDIDDIDYIWD